MRRIRVLPAALVAAFVSGIVLHAAPAAAHHSRAGFTLDRTAEMKVTVTKVRWSNPHVFFDGFVIGAGGRREEWVFEGHSISGMTRNGWTRDTVKPGDLITVNVNLSREPDRHFALLDNAVLGTGQRLYAVGVAPPVPGAAPPRVTASTDFSGNWRYRFPGTPEQIRQRVLLGAPPPSADGPYTARAQAQIKAYRETDNPTYRCLPISLPQLLMTVYEYRWERRADRIVIHKEQYLDAERTIWLNGAKRPAGFRPNHLGFSTGRFEPDGTLVVETTGFSPQPWGNGPGIDSSAKKRIVERYRLVNGGLGLELRYTLEDPEYFTQPVEVTGTFTKSPDSSFAPQPKCDLKAARQHLAFER